MKYTILLGGLLAVSLIFSPVAEAAEGVADCRVLDNSQGKQALKRVELAYEGLNSFEAKFSQVAYMLGLDESKESKGTMSFKKTARMDWHYEAPVEQRFVTDGTTVWFHQPDLNQVSIGEFKQAFSSDLPVSFLLGLSSLSESFSLQSYCESAEDAKFTLKPNAVDASIASFELQVGKKDFLPRVAKIVDVGGNENTIVLTFTSNNQPVEDQRFVFEIPKGVDVIVQDTAQPEVKKEIK